MVGQRYRDAGDEQCNEGTEGEFVDPEFADEEDEGDGADRDGAARGGVDEFAAGGRRVDAELSADRDGVLRGVPRQYRQDTGDEKRTEGGALDDTADQDREEQQTGPGVYERSLAAEADGNDGSGEKPQADHSGGEFEPMGKRGRSRDGETERGDDEDRPAERDGDAEPDSSTSPRESTESENENADDGDGEYPSLEDRIGDE